MTTFLKNKNKEERKKIRISFKTFNRFLVVFIIIAGIYYVAGTNDLTVKGFEIQKLKLSLKETQDANKSLELETMAIGSYNNLGERINQLNMVAVGNVEYLNGSGLAVAKK